MIKTLCTLVQKKALTHDVYELVYHYTGSTSIEPGQYVMFLLAPGLSRAYSIASFSDGQFLLIIKRIEGGAGSPMICDANIGDEFLGMIGLGHFTLKDPSSPSAFIGTGTGFAPLYCQIEAMLAHDPQAKISLQYGVREERDIFYKKEMADWRAKNPHFEYTLSLSREHIEGYHHGYVTDWICESNIGDFKNFYICGSPAMVDDAKTKLLNLGVQKEQIFFEKY